MTDPKTHAFGLDAVGLDDRMRLFGFITADQRHDYLWILRAIDLARASYQVVLSTEAVARSLDALAERGGVCPRSDEMDLAARLDALDEWGVLDRTQDATRAATLAEYRRRHSVYQFTEAGHRAFTAVESVLGATMEEASLSRTVFQDLLEDLGELAEANRSGDGETVFRRFGRIDRSLNDIAERAASNESSPRRAPRRRRASAGFRSGWSRCARTARSPRSPTRAGASCRSCGSWRPCPRTTNRCRCSRSGCSATPRPSQRGAGAPCCCGL